MWGGNKTEQYEKNLKYNGNLKYNDYLKYEDKLDIMLTSNLNTTSNKPRQSKSTLLNQTCQPNASKATKTKHQNEIHELKSQKKLRLPWPWHRSAPACLFWTKNFLDQNFFNLHFFGTHFFVPKIFEVKIILDQILLC